ncbi:MAG: phosphatidylserine decarboxylase [bacterium]
MKRIYKVVAITVVVISIIVASGIIFFGRVIPRNTPDHGIVAPASGKIISIFDTDNPTIVFEKQGVTNNVTLPEFSGPVHVILIELNLGDVHVQRSPISGTIVRMDHFDGDHVNALGSEKTTIAATNEKVVSVFKNNTTTIGVVQVAGRAARRIRNSAPVGSSVTTGQMYGRILLGSQVVVIIPQHIPLNVQLGEKLVDGETLLVNQ